MINFRETSKRSKIIALLISLISFGLIVFYSTVVASLTEFAYKYMGINQDGDHDSYSFIIKFALILLIALGFFISASLLLNLHKKLLNFINSIINTEKLQETIFTDKLTSKRNFSKIVFITTTIYAIILQLIFYVFDNIYDVGAGSKDENIAEYLSSLLLVISSVVLFIIVVILKNVNVPKMDKRIIRISLTLFSLMLLLVFMEEISWGQQIFQWETKGALKDVNFQSETNLHNVIQPLLKFIYPLAGMGLFIVLFLLWFFPKGKEPFWLSLLTPHISLIYLVFFMACVSFEGLLLSELFELLFYPFILLYSIRILICIKYPNNSVKKVFNK